MSKSPVFVRDATGLVKSMGTFDAFLTNFIATAPTLGAVGSLGIGPLVFPGGSLVIASVIAMIAAIFMATTYAMVTSSMPRSGGDYVFVSRTIHPVIGLFTSMNLTYWVFAFWGFNGFLAATYFGRIMNDIGFSSLSAWLGTPYGLFSGATVDSILGGLLIAFGLRRFFRVQLAVSIFYSIGVFMMIGVLALYGGQFHQAFNQWAAANHVLSGSNDPYQSVISTAASQGFVNPGFSWPSTMGLAAVMFGSFLLPIWSTFIAGEQKRATDVRKQIIAFVGSTLYCGIIVIALVAAIQNAASMTFQGSLLTIASSLPVEASTYDFYARLITPYMWFVDLATLASVFLFIPLDMLATTRALFAWSFDRILPAKFAYVSDRLHTPLFALIVSMVAAELMIYLFAFTNAPGLYAATTFGIVVTVFIAALAVMIFPKTLSAQYNTSSVKRTVGGVPAISIVGVITAIIFAWISYYFVIFPQLYGFSSVTLYSIIVLFIAALVLFYGAKWYRYRQGLDLGVAFKQIPPE